VSRISSSSSPASASRAPSALKALVVDDDLKVAQLITRVLAEEGWIADRCAHGQDAVRRAGGVDYDVIVLDWMLPDVDGLTVCRELRCGGVATPLIMLTARDDPGERVLGLDAGADDYMVKPFDIDELLARIGALVRRSRGFSRLRVGALEFDRLRRVVSLDGQVLDLTGQEYALLLCLARQAGRVVPRCELVEQVWAMHFDPRSNLVDVQVSRLREKLGA
jgi:DNA-binding response OmpR family regulator